MIAQGEDILAWLNDAITTREQAAGGADSGVWSAIATGYEEWEATVGSSSYNGGAIANCHMEEARHIAANDPASVLRRCAADRKLLTLHAGKMHSCPATDETGYLDEWTQFDHSEVCPVVEHLAEGYGWTAGQTPPTEGDQVT
jgi:hypothetical protein